MHRRKDLESVSAGWANREFNRGNITLPDSIVQYRPGKELTTRTVSLPIPTPWKLTTSDSMKRAQWDARSSRASTVHTLFSVFVRRCDQPVGFSDRKRDTGQITSQTLPRRIEQTVKVPATDRPLLSPSHPLAGVGPHAGRLRPEADCFYTAHVLYSVSALRTRYLSREEVYHDTQRELPLWQSAFRSRS